jgi:hypothetical protein
MFNIIEDLRQKNDKTKKRVAFLIAFLLSGIIFTIWITVIYPDFVKQKNEEKSEMIESSGPVSTFTNSFSRVVYDMKEQFKDLQKSIMGSSHYPSESGVK